jgi:toxin-antitoxin system PIN domain toxin
VIAVDTNLLVYAHRRDSEWHAEAQQHVRNLAEGRESWAIPWPCIHEFISVVTHPRIFRPPSPLRDAIAQVDAWLESPTLVLLSEGGAHWAALRTVLEAAKAVGPLVHDARVASLCREHGVRELWTADRDFSRFRGLPFRNPLVR